MGSSALQQIIIPFLDIAILTIIIYQLIKIFARTRALFLLRGAFWIVLFYAFAFFLNLEASFALLNSFSSILLIVLVIILQPELRNMITHIGQSPLFGKAASTNVQQIETVINSSEVLAGYKRGGLFVFSRVDRLRNVVDSGTALNAEISTSLLLSIFRFDTPLHDGAAIIRGDRIIAAGCFLPLSEQMDIKRSFGTRHRAALGIAETSDAVVLVVSEETSSISLAYDANFYYDLTISEIRKTLLLILTGNQPKISAKD